MVNKIVVRMSIPPVFRVHLPEPLPPLPHTAELRWMRGPGGEGYGVFPIPSTNVEGQRQMNKYIYIYTFCIYYICLYNTYKTSPAFAGG
jgi:hypothetical protein